MDSRDQREKGNSLSKQPTQQYVTWLVKQMTMLAMARQATVDSATLKFFAVSLSIYSIEFVESAINQLCHTKRAQGETAFPDLATIEEAIQEKMNEQARLCREAEDREVVEREARNREMHPEDYITMAEIYQIVRERQAAKVSQMPQRTRQESLDKATHLSPEDQAKLQQIISDKAV